MESKDEYEIKINWSGNLCVRARLTVFYFHFLAYAFIGN